METMAQGSGQLLGSVFPFAVEMENLPRSMNPGVGAAAPVDTNGQTQDLGNPRLQDVLNGGATGLALPTREVTAIVGANALPADHSSGPVSSRFGSGPSRKSCRMSVAARESTSPEARTARRRFGAIVDS